MWLVILLFFGTILNRRFFPRMTKTETLNSFKFSLWVMELCIPMLLVLILNFQYGLLCKGCWFLFLFSLLHFVIDLH